MSALPQLTLEQSAAIYGRGASIALSAGAGCGKTFVLTERFLSCLEPPTGGGEATDLDELIAITFTDRAAREMRDRIRDKCAARLKASPPDQAAHWLRLLRGLDGARVSTIHAFCGTLLRSHAVEAALDPRFSVMDASQAETLFLELIDDELRRRLAARDDMVIELMEKLDLRGLRQAISSLWDSSRSWDCGAWLQKDAAEIVEQWSNYHHQRVVPALIRRIADSHECRLLMAAMEDGDPTNAVMRERFGVLRSKIPHLSTSPNLAADLATVRASAMVKGGGSKKEWPSESSYDCFKVNAQAFRKIIDDKILPHLSFDPQPALAEARLGQQALAITLDVVAEYERRKQQLSCLDFDDLLVRARRLLTDPAHDRLRERMALHTKLLLVDECQDTDPVQVDLIRALCGAEFESGKLFFVGDYKQSIYRFRGADPEVFRALREETPSQGRLALTRNFRSQPPILDFVNALFRDDLGGAGQSYEKLVPHRARMSAEPAIEFLWSVEPTDDQGRVGRKDAAAARRREADWIARRLRAMVDCDTSGSADGKPVLAARSAAAGERAADRPAVSPGDIAILFRALSNVALYEEALRKWGLDYYLVGGHAFYAQQEIFDLLNVLRSLVSAADEVSLAGALRSPFFSLADETLYWLARHPRGLSGGLFEGSPPEPLDAEQRRRCEVAAATLKDLRALKDRLPIAALIQELLNRTGYDAILTCEFMGERKLANLRKLIEQARSFDQGGEMGLADYVVQLSQFIVKQPREALAATHPEKTNVIRLMTIHQSKGLEFPVVVVPDLEWSRRNNDKSAIFDPDLGPLLQIPNPAGDDRSMNGFRLRSLVTAEADEAEAIRLLYVAATRAEDYLILSSSVGNLDEPRGIWMELLARRFDLRTGACRAELPPGWNAPQVRVTAVEPAAASRAAERGANRNLAKSLERVRVLAESDGPAVPRGVFPVEQDPSSRQQYSVSRLTGSLHGAVDRPEHRFHEIAEPSGTPPVDPLGLGSLVHETLANVHFQEDGRNLAETVLRFADKHVPGLEAERSEAIQMLQEFWKSPRRAILANARELFTEMEFLLPWPEGRNQSERYLQGYLDCLYRTDDGRWRLLDYKTNRVTRKNLPELARAYEMQMFVYGLAAESALGEPLAELTLHFLRSGLEHRYEWDDNSRSRAAQIVEQAMQTAIRGGEGKSQPAPPNLR